MKIYYSIILLAIVSILTVSCENKKKREVELITKDTTQAVIDTSLLKWQEKLSFASDKIRFFIDNRIPNERYFLLDRELFSSVLIPRYYIKNDFTPTWFNEDTLNLNRANEMIAYIERLSFHGLQPKDYHLEHIKNLVYKIENENYNETDISHLDIFLTDAFFIIASHLYNGKVDPEAIETQWGIQRGRPELMFDDKLSNMLNEQTAVSIFMERFYPLGNNYKFMIQKAMQLEDLNDEEVLLTIPIDSLANDSLVKTVYRNDILNRLYYLGYASDKQKTKLKDADLSKLITRFQKQNGLNTDGKIGKHTYEALNQPIRNKLMKLYVNMERLRWLNISSIDTIVSINIADFTLTYRKGLDTLLKSRTVVGKGFRQTPVFESKISYLVFAPTWTIPPTILNQDILPKVIKDTSYLTQHSMIILDRSGNKVSSNAINWSKAVKGDFPYLIRQKSGSDNPLGKVKFMFPNKYSVYVHDTPTKSLFKHDERTFSSGCIRMDKPKEFATLLLDDTTNWNTNIVDSAMHLKNETTVVLNKPIKVSIYYLTAWADSEQNIHFRKDIYNRDERLFNALKAPAHR